MSGYENYTETSRAYDMTRAAVGIELVLGALSTSGTAVSQQRLLDAGCGTGNYSLALASHVAAVDAVDINAAMLRIAHAKCVQSAAATKIQCYRASLSQLPFAPATFDAIVVNQVLHHLPESESEGFPRHAAAIQEFARVSAPGATLVINQCSPEQLRRGFWPYRLIPHALDNMVARHIPTAQLTRLLAVCGYDIVERYVPLDATLQGPAFFDPLGPLKPEWRDGDSIWRLVTETEMSAVRARLGEARARGELQAMVSELDADRAVVGQTTFVVARLTRT